MLLHFETIAIKSTGLKNLPVNIRGRENVWVAVSVYAYDLISYILLARGRCAS